MSWGCIVLTQGRRPELLAAALESVRRQRGVEVDTVVVGNGWEPEGLPAGVKALALQEDRGIPGGRNAGVGEVGGDLLLFLDDDGELEGDDVLARMEERYAAEPSLAMLQGRVRASDGGPAPRDWVPRLRVGDRARSSEVTTVWEGVVSARRSAFEQVGGWTGAFRFAHEGIDLSWRLLDAGWRLRYAGDIVVRHPSYRPASREYSPYYGARNRVWIARRYLPAPLGAIYVASFAARMAPLLWRSPARMRSALRGYRDGLRGPGAGPRRPLRPRKLWRMVRAGRPPII
jgi:GT2 family glycosyltransferase